MPSSDKRCRPAAETLEPFLGRAVEGQAAKSSVFADLLGAKGRIDAAGDTEQARREADAEASLRAAELDAAVERGRVEGDQAVRSEFGEAADGFRAAVEALAASRVEMREHYERELLGVAVSVAEKILADELTQDPDRWIGMLRAGVARVLDRDSIRIRVGGSLHHFLSSREAELVAALDGVREMALVEDASLRPTDCVIETTYGDLDLSLGSQLEALADHLLDRP